MVRVRQDLVSSSKYSIKCPYSMTPSYITVHNTANDASAANEVAYMKRNNNKVSFHIAFDDKEGVQGIPFNRNAWHAGDGGGNGNRKSIGVEICYSKSGGSRFDAAERNAAEWIASELKRRGWGLDRVKRHYDWSGKNCPHRTMANGWQRFLNMVAGYMDEGTSGVNSLDEIANEVIAGKWGNGSTRKERLESAGYDYRTVQNRVNELLGAVPSSQKYYKSFSSTSIVDGLKSIGVNSSFSNRKKIAAANGISNYTGTAAQNVKLLELAKKGKLKKA